jgi:hypothetical protein
MRSYLFILFCAVIIGAVLCSACLSPPDPVYKPDVSTTELRVEYSGPVSANYGTGDCIAKKEITTPWVLQFAKFNCHMVYASFGKVKNDTSTSVLKANLVRDGKVIKSYSTTNSAVHFEKIPEFLVRSKEEPNLVQDTPLRVSVITDGKWDVTVTDAFGYQAESGSGAKTFVLEYPVFPITACISGDNTAAGTPPVVELMFPGDTIAIGSGTTKNTYNEYCATMK